MILGQVTKCAFLLMTSMFFGLYVMDTFNPESNAILALTGELPNTVSLTENDTIQHLKNVLEELRAKRHIFDFRPYNYEDIERELIEISGDCLTGLCRSRRIARTFCETCGICDIVKSVRFMLFSMSPEIPIHLQTPIGDPNNPDDVHSHDPHTACIRRAIEACPKACSKEQLRADKRGPILMTYNKTSQAYMFHFPEAYRCPRRRNIQTICINTHYWLKDIDNVNFDDGISSLWAPKTIICFHENTDIFEILKADRNIIIFNEA